MDPLAYVNPTDQAVFLIKLLVNVAPVAFYFLALGLLNSQSSPRLVSGRSDFIVLTLVFVPVLVWPVPMLATRGLWPVLLGCGVLAGVAFTALLPHRHGSWVIYNIATPRCRRLLEAALREIGCDFRRTDDGYDLPSEKLHIGLSPLPLLRNVTLHFRPPVGREQIAEQLRLALERRLDGVQLLPTATGTCLVVLGVALLILPVWLVGRHMDIIVQAIGNLLPA